MSTGRSVLAPRYWAVLLATLAANAAFAGEASPEAGESGAAEAVILVDDLDVIPPVSIPTERDGETVYRHYCGYCHEYSIGREILGRSLPAETTAYIVRNGINSMPAFRQTDISDAELQAIAAYVEETAAFEGSLK